jgi:hypothetical protein
MSFGFSVGDFIAVSKLIGEIVGSLRSIGGASSDYQELVRELDSLDKALRHVLRLDHNGPPSELVVLITQEILDCKVPLEDIKLKIRKYEKSLGSHSRPNVARATVDKLGWTFLRKGDIEKLQTHLRTHASTISILLAEYGLQQMALNDKHAREHAIQIRKDNEATHSLLASVKKDCSTQIVSLQNSHSMLTGLYDWIYGDLSTALQHFGQVVNAIR